MRPGAGTPRACRTLTARRLITFDTGVLVALALTADPDDLQLFSAHFPTVVIEPI